MPLPALTTMAAAASLVTCVRSSWEMTRMVRAKKRLNQEERKAVRVLEDLEDLLDDGVLDEDQFNNFCDQLEFAMRERDITAVRRLQNQMATLRRRIDYTPFPGNNLADERFMRCHEPFHEMAPTSANPPASYLNHRQVGFSAIPFASSPPPVLFPEGNSQPPTLNLHANIHKSPGRERKHSAVIVGGMPPTPMVLPSQYGNVMSYRAAREGPSIRRRSYSSDSACDR